MKPFAGNRLNRVLGGLPVNALPYGNSNRSPVLAIVGSLLVGATLAVVLLLFSVASGGSEPLVTGSVLFAFGLGWALMAFLSTRFSAQPQTWTALPAVILGSTGLGLIVFQPGPAVMDLMGWVWPFALALLAIWMVAQVRRSLRGRGRWLVVPVIATLMLFAVGGGIATVTAATASGSATAAGRMIDVGGYRLYIECSGSGSPTVVLQSGLTETSAYWVRIAPAIAQTTAVCIYDRAGHGRSESADGPQDGIALASDLHTLLERAGIAGPHVLVGHSSGGPYVRVFAERYSDDVAGMVLLDAQPADAFTALPAYPTIYQGLRTAGVLSPSLARVGLLGPLLGLPAHQSTPVVARNARDEILVLPTTLRQAAALTSIGDRPLIVVTAVSGAQAGWLPAQEQMADLSSNAAQRVVEGATHDSLITGDDSVSSSRAILDVVASIRAGRAVR
jgi:pimeloyl-ACP methyl ester carboxylesterase